MSIADSSINESPTIEQITNAQNAISNERHQIIRLKKALEAVLQIKLRYAKVFDPSKYNEYLAQYGHTPAYEIIGRIRLGFSEDTKVVGTRIKGEPYAHDANRRLDKMAHEINALETAAKVAPENQIIYGENQESREEPKTGTEEMMAMLGIQGCLVPGSKEERIDISDEHLRILGAQISEAVKQCDKAEQESVAQLIKEGPKL